MNARTIRRAMERKAAKQARKETAKLMAVSASGSFAGVAAYEEQVCEDIILAPEPSRTSAAQLEANRRNALRSTGPTTPEGKSRASRNALQTGLTGRTVLLPSDDAALYEHHVQSFFEELNPAGDRETELVQSIADSKWRLARIPSLEFGIYALGRIQFAEEFQNVSKAEAAALIEAKTFLAYQKQLNNLSIQESRLRRQCEKDSAELTRLQQLRTQAERAATRKIASQPTPPKPQPAETGSEFSTADFSEIDRELDYVSNLLAHPTAA